MIKIKESDLYLHKHIYPLDSTYRIYIPKHIREKFSTHYFFIREESGKIILEPVEIVKE
ncbi:MAG: AbrB/MazE/SpoVT family DNA-binding domain-containing protein [Elusimicrobiota bacterium]|nr:AbrB/MazE/SpoVT family DNA-binding domain-containing protein [Endomicrobiia bacterium]MDW8166843.1 AbrB/MazE/SpoVT family DNA-binding domain-containing protein [Elusimicrobiota bacterium]